MTSGVSGVIHESGDNSSIIPSICVSILRKDSSSFGELPSPFGLTKAVMIIPSLISPTSAIWDKSPITNFESKYFSGRFSIFPKLAQIRSADNSASLSALNRVSSVVLNTTAIILEIFSAAIFSSASRISRTSGLPLKKSVWLKERFKNPFRSSQLTPVFARPSSSAIECPTRRMISPGVITISGALAPRFFKTPRIFFMSFKVSFE